MGNKQKQANGAGSVTKRKDGTWMGRISVGYDDNGKLKRKTFYGKTQKEVREKMIKLMHELNTGIYFEQTKITAEEWFDTWLFEYKRNCIRTTTFASYEMNIRRNVCPYIGKILLKDLRPEHIQKLYNKLLEIPLSAKTIRNIHNIIHEALEQAVKNNLVIRNVSEAVTPPRRVKPDIRVLTLEEQGKLLDAVKGHRLEMAFRLDLATGMRLGELLGLRWQDVDLDEEVIRINQTLYRATVFDNDKQSKTKLIFEEPKSKSGNRSIPLPASIAVELREYKTEQDELKEALGDSFNPNNLVFTSQNGTPLEPRSFIKQFHKVVERSAIDHANVHAMRHSFATRLLEADEHPKVVQDLMGHANISMTLDTYSHVMPDKKKKAAEKLNSLFDNNSKA